tara:strand:+ start:281 stop:577 length:297 start_codon:yes stop_codon:yes gene_type:complete
MIKALLIVTTLAGGNYTSELPDMKSCLEARAAITKQDNTVKSLCIPKSDESAKMREFFGIFMGMVDQIMERQELDRLNRDLERQDRPCLLCTEQSEEE